MDIDKVINEAVQEKEKSFKANERVYNNMWDGIENSLNRNLRWYEKMNLKIREKKVVSNSMNVLKVAIFTGIIITSICISKYGVFQKSNNPARVVNNSKDNENKPSIDIKENDSAAYKNLCKPIENKPQGYGMSFGNAAGALKVAEMENGWIYYAVENKIYKVKNNDDKKQLIYEGDKKVFDINILNGWIYFTEAGGKFCKMNIDGKEFKVLQKENFSKVQIVEDNIFFENNKAFTFRMNINDNNAVKIYGNCNLQCQILNNEIYFNGGHAEDCKLFKMDINGENKKTLVEEPIYTLCAYDEWIYFVANKKIYKIKKDGTDKSLVYSCTNSFDRAMTINVTKDYIFFTVNKSVDGINDGAKNTLYKIKKDGTEVTLICDDISRLSGLSVAGSWIYYKEYSNEKLCRVSLDGKINEKLEDTITK